jgi:hypothetical protein
MRHLLASILATGRHVRTSIRDDIPSAPGRHGGVLGRARDLYVIFASFYVLDSIRTSIHLENLVTERA